MRYTNPRLLILSESPKSRLLQYVLLPFPIENGINDIRYFRGAML